MQRIQLEDVTDGLHPSELVVTILTAGGATEEIAVDRGLVEDRRMKAYPVLREADRVLVELPRETMSGSWRVWIPASSVFSTAEAAA